VTAPAVLADVLAELPVPEDGTLSRTLYRDDDLRLVGFAFAAGQELTDHASALSVVLQVLRGRLDLQVGDRRLELTPAGWVWIPPRVTHSLTALEPTVMLLTMTKQRQ
jgi:quercetin dioxygenase-like cupin family protein